MLKKICDFKLAIVCSFVSVSMLAYGTVLLLRMWQNSPSPQFVPGFNCDSTSGVRHVDCGQDNVTSGEGTPPTAAVGPRITIINTTSNTTTIAPPPPGEFRCKIRKSFAKTDADIQSGMDTLNRFECGHPKITDDRVSYGEESKLFDYPWMALLVYDNVLEKTLDCSGSLITDRHVLTAAHCIFRKFNLVSVRLGEHDIKTPIDCIGHGQRKKCAPALQEIDIEEAIYHRDFRPSTLSNDIGLIRLVSPATFRKNVSPICLPITPASQEVTLKRMIIAGWGLMENFEPANVLRMALVPIKSNSYCKGIFKLIQVSEKQLCAGGERNIRTCLGDSGGPLFNFADYRRSERYVQYGIVTAGGKICGSNFPNVFVKVTSYLDWITANLR